jgi:hypothetical protein
MAHANFPVKAQACALMRQVNAKINVFYGLIVKHFEALLAPFPGRAGLL